MGGEDEGAMHSAAHASRANGTAPTAAELQSTAGRCPLTSHPSPAGLLPEHTRMWCYGAPSRLWASGSSDPELCCMFCPDGGSPMQESRGSRPQGLADCRSRVSPGPLSGPRSPVGVHRTVSHQLPAPHGLSGALPYS